MTCLLPLVQHHKYLVEQGLLPKEGWSFVKASYVAFINDNGDLEQLGYIKQKTNGKKIKAIPQNLVLPARRGRSNDTVPNFLADNGSYTFGIGVESEKKSTTLEHFEAYKAFHKKILSSVDCLAARALLAFFDKWNPSEYKKCPALSDFSPKELNDGNIVFRYKDQYIHEVPEIKTAWQKFYDDPGDAPMGLCIVTGQIAPIARIHPFIKGVVGSAPSGGKLVSFNNEIVYSDGHVDGLNAPVSIHAAFAYTEALNYMLADKEHSFVMGDISVVCWAKNGRGAYQNDFIAALRGESKSYSTAEIQDMTSKLCKGDYVSFNENELDKDCTFYVLGLSASKSRIAVRFFYEDSFGNLLDRIREHKKRLKIDAPDFEDPVEMSLWRLIAETKPRPKKSNALSKNGKSEPEKRGKFTTGDEVIYRDTLNAILNDGSYPSALLSGVLSRIWAEREVTPGRAAILKAYFLESPHYEVPESVLGETLNPDCENIPYNLGRLFSVLENIQWYYNPDTKETIKNRYFNGAATFPAANYPSALSLSDYHLERLDEKKQLWIKKQLSEIMAKINENYPISMSVQQQAAFYLGYYQQTRQRYHKTNKNNEEEFENE